jgi:hypothetical protein
MCELLYLLIYRDGGSPKFMYCSYAIAVRESARTSGLGFVPLIYSHGGHIGVVDNVQGGVRMVLDIR